MAKQLDLDVLVPEDIVVTLNGKSYVIKGTYLTTEKSLDVRKVQEELTEDEMNLEPLVDFAKKILIDNNAELAEKKDFFLNTKQAYAIFQLLATEIYAIEESQLEALEQEEVQQASKEMVRPLKEPQDHKKKKRR